MNETWSYDFNTNTWTNMNPSVKPPAATIGQSMAYDSESDRVVMFGGAVWDQTWSYDFNTNLWTNVNPTTRPSGRSQQAMVYDSQSDNTILFGGAAGSTYYNDTWTYDLNTNTWTELSPSVAPPERTQLAMTYDSRSDHVILFGGRSPEDTYYSDTWMYGSVLPLAPQGLQATPGDSRVTLSWQAPLYNGGSPITNYEVFRGTLAIDLALLVEIGNVLSYTDTEVANGITYIYQVTARNAAGEGPSSAPVSVTPATHPSAPLNLQATAGDTQVTLSWGVPSSDGGFPIIGYRIYSGVTSGSLTFLIEVGDVLSYTATALYNGFTYYYSVRAKNSVGEGPESNEAFAVPAAALDTTGPTVVINFPVSGALLSSRYVAISGNASDDTGVLWVETSIDETNWVLADGTASWSAILTLKEGVNILYVRATDTSGNYQTASVTVTVQTPRTPGQPENPFLAFLGANLFWLIPVVILSGLGTILMIVKRERRTNR